MESKRQRLGGGGALPDESSQLADVLGKLTALLAKGGGEADGLDDLLEQLGRLQAKLNGTSEPAFKAIEDAQARLQVGSRCSCCRRLPPPRGLAKAAVHMPVACNARHS
jgi:hypothetical protein